MKISRDFLRLNIIPLVLLAGIIFTAAFTFFYSSTLRAPDGRIIAGKELRDFTIDFARCINLSGETPEVTREGVELLRQSGAWLQLLDENGSELLSIDKPASAPALYRPYELLRLYQYGDGEYSVFVSSAESGGASCTYLIGFPVSVSKIVMYVDSQRYASGKLVAAATAALTMLLILALGVFFNAVISRNLDRICSALRAVADRSYTPQPQRRVLREIYDGVDALDRDLAAAEERRAQDQRARQEWLVNITHDLKTPLAPIRGYAELLTDGGELKPEQVRCYGGSILRNCAYAEQLVDDLKLTYQLQSGMLPLELCSQDLCRFTRELIIDLLNSPEYQNRSIEFSSPLSSAQCSFDARLLRRALTNIIVNTLKHNGPATLTSVSISREDGEYRITVTDDGVGMSADELSGLFTRYYRGSGAMQHTEGSGLGMAIAKQIAEAHGGSIRAESSPGLGTSVTITLPSVQRKI